MSRVLEETDRPDSIGAGAAKAEVEDERARVARKKEELVDNFMLKGGSRTLADGIE